MKTKNSRISLADWIASLRASLDDAVRRRKELEAANGGPLMSRLLVEEITLEATIEAERTEGVEPKIACWIAEVSGEKKTTNKSAQKVTIKLKPTDIIHLGERTSADSGTSCFLPQSEG